MDICNRYREWLYNVSYYSASNIPHISTYSTVVPSTSKQNVAVANCKTNYKTINLYLAYAKYHLAYAKYHSQLLTM